MNRSYALISALRGIVPYEAVPASNQTLAASVYITPQDLIPVLDSYLNGHITPTELQRWSSWVLGQDEFCVQGWEDDSIADRYEPMWYVLQQLSTPLVDGEITQERVREHVSTLSSL